MQDIYVIGRAGQGSTKMLERVRELSSTSERVQFLDGLKEPSIANPLAAQLTVLTEAKAMYEEAYATLSGCDGLLVYMTDGSQPDRVAFYMGVAYAMRKSIALYLGDADIATVDPFIVLQANLLIPSSESLAGFIKDIYQ